MVNKVGTSDFQAQQNNNKKREILKNEETIYNVRSLNEIDC